MQNTAHMNGYGFMSGDGVWSILAILLAIFLVVGIFRMLQKK
jgi:hypothetical protein